MNGLYMFVISLIPLLLMVLRSGFRFLFFVFFLLFCTVAAEAFIYVLYAWYYCYIAVLHYHIFIIWNWDLECICVAVSIFFTCCVHCFYAISDIRTNNHIMAVSTGSNGIGIGRVGCEYLCHFAICNRFSKLYKIEILWHRTFTLKRFRAKHLYWWTIDS